MFEGNPYPRAVNGSLWTLPIEVRMYAALLAVWGMAWLLARRRHVRVFRAAVLVLAVGGAVAHLAVHVHPPPSVHTIRLFFMFFTGATYQVLKARVPLSFAAFGGCALALLAAAYDVHVFFYVYSLTIAYVVLYLAYVPGGLLRAYNRLGDYSYGTYIYAFPIQQAVVALLPGVSIAGLTALAAPLTLACAALSWHLLEKPALGLRARCVAATRRRVSTG